MAGVATRAGVALDTIYETIGTKVELFQIVLDMYGLENHSQESATENTQRPSRARGAVELLTAFAQRMTQTHEHHRPALTALNNLSNQQARATSIWRRLLEQIDIDVNIIIEELDGTGELDPQLALSTVKDILWSMVTPEYYITLTTIRGWSPDRFCKWSTSAWPRLLLKRNFRSDRSQL